MITITIALGGKYAAIEAEPLKIAGIPLAIHKSVRGKGWTISDPGSGYALGHGETKEKARYAVAIKIGSQDGAKLVQARLSELRKAPEPHTVQAFRRPTPVVKAGADIRAIIDHVDKAVGGLTEQERGAVARALNTTTGRLKAKCPPGLTLAAAAWQGLQPNPHKVSVGRVMLFKGESRDLIDKLTRVQWPAEFDKDMHALKKMGAW